MDNGPTLPPLAGGMGGGMGGGTVPSNLAYLRSNVSSLSFSTISAFRLIGWNNGGAPSMQPYGGGAGGGMQHQVMDCAKAFVGTYSSSQSSLLIVWDLFFSYFIHLALCDTVEK
jgi:hypothetical protein